MIVIRIGRLRLHSSAGNVLPRNVHEEMVRALEQHSIANNFKAGIAPTLEAGTAFCRAQVKEFAISHWNASHGLKPEHIQFTITYTDVTASASTPDVGEFWSALNIQTGGWHKI